jgi:uncharacterized protein YyaL (SSP411 family)
MKKKSGFPWTSFGNAAFERAQADGKPVLLVLHSPARFETGVLAETAAKSFICVLAEAWDRPDIHARYSSPSGISILSSQAEILHIPDLGQSEMLMESLLGLAKSYSSNGANPIALPPAPVWTGAVGVPELPVLDPGGPRELTRRLKEDASRADFEAIELLLHAACEWGDEEAGRHAATRLESLLKKPRITDFPELARFTKLFADASRVLRKPLFSEMTRVLSNRVVSEFLDSDLGAFRHGKGASPFADANAMACVALMRASLACGRPEGFREALSALVFLERQLYDPLLGMIHRRGPSDPLVFGLLRDNAWTALAATEAYLATGERPWREFADALIRFMFQELWDHGRGGFLDRAVRSDDLGPMKTPVFSSSDNSVAFEALWRLRHIKGNAHYGRWLDWGLRALADQDKMASASLARTQDIGVGARMEVELVGKIGDPRVNALLSALHRHYLPRLIVSFIDPDDQDYILAHKLTAESFPHAFACRDLKPIASAGKPEDVAEMIRRLKLA